MAKSLWIPLSVALVVPVAALTIASRPEPPHCRVEALAYPRFGSEFNTLLVRLLPGCPPDGIARIRLGGYGGPGSHATGPTETLSVQRPALLWQAQPNWRTVLWEAQSGVTYSVPIQRR